MPVDFLDSRKQELGTDSFTIELLFCVFVVVVFFFYYYDDGDDDNNDIVIHCAVL